MNDPAEAIDTSENEMTLETATLGAGCFWCVEAIFEELRGVHSVRSGYSGGITKDPTYKEVCSGATGHAEVVQISFDSSVISFETILKVFFTVHDPTTLNRQGADVGTQYRSVIFYHNEFQKAIAEEVKQEIEDEGLWDDPIVTFIDPFDTFYVAENYHQEYYKMNQEQPYCSAVISPKIAKFRSKFKNLLKGTQQN